MHEGYLVKITGMTLKEWTVVAEIVWLLQLLMQVLPITTEVQFSPMASCN